MAEKNKRLALGRDHPRQLADVMDEAHVEHLVGLVEDEDLDVRQHDSALVDEIEQPAGRGDEDVDAIGEVADLLADGHAAEHDGRAQLEEAAIGAEALRDLAGQFAGGAQHEAAAALAGRRALVGIEALENGKREGGRLAGAGLGDAQDVAALEHEGNGLRLDGRGGLVILGCQRLQEGSGEAEVSKSGHVVSFIGCGVRPDAIAHERTLRPRWPWGTPRVIWDVLKEIEGVEPWLEAGRILKDPITQPDCSVSRCDGKVYGPSQLRSQAGSEFLLNAGRSEPCRQADPEA